MIYSRLLISVVLIFLLTSVGCAQDQITTIILIRHAEKANDGTNDPPLSEIGQRRALVLAEFLSTTSVEAIYSTNYKRTRNTVAPVSEEKGVEVKQYEAFNEKSIDNILQENIGKTVLIVGHSNNIPWIANYLTGSKDFADWEDKEYDNLWIVSLVQKGDKARVIKLTMKISDKN